MYLEKYQTDEEGNSYYFRKPEVVVFPGTTEEVALIVKLANQYLVPITPRSAGSGVACGAIPVYHGIVVELERMNQILKFDADNMYAVCQTGVITGQQQEEAAETRPALCRRPVQFRKLHDRRQRREQCRRQ
jgi:glycolate oxidase